MRTLTEYEKQEIREKLSSRKSSITGYDRRLERTIERVTGEKIRNIWYRWVDFPITDFENIIN